MDTILMLVLTSYAVIGGVMAIIMLIRFLLKWLTRIIA